MRIGVFFDGFSSPAEMLEVARRAEDAGAASLWFAQHMGYRDAFVWGTVAAQATRTIALVPTAISPYLWPPLPIAMAMGTLAEMAGDRARLVVSVGNLLNLGKSGWEPVAPIRVMREYVEALRALDAGAAVQLDGRVHHLRGAKMAFGTGRRYPIYVGSTGPQMLRLAGEIGDGVLLSAGLTLASCRDCLAHAAAGLVASGRSPAAFSRASFINFRAARTEKPRKRRCCGSSRSCFATAAMPTTSSHLGLPSITRRSSSASPRTISMPRPGCCRWRPRTYLQSPARRPSAAHALRNILRSALMSRSSR